MDTNNSQVDISVVLPIYNEEGNMEPLLEEIVQALTPLEKKFEIVCVDDCSKDSTVEKLKELREKDARVILLQHHKNFGQSAAQATGFHKAKGDIIVTLDSDRQNNPADIPKLLALIGEYDCVCGIRKKRRDNIIRKISSRTANKIRDWLTGDSVKDSGCNLRAIKKEALEEIPLFNGTHRFMPTLLRIKGKKVKEIEVDHRPRTWGKSNYGVWNRALRGLRDCLGIRWWKARSFPQNRCKSEK